MVLKLIDDRHALDPLGRIWVREGDRWSKARRNAQAAVAAGANGRSKVVRLSRARAAHAATS